MIALLLLLSARPEIVLQTGQREATFVVTSADGRFAVVAGTGGAKLWHVPSRREVRSFRLPGKATALAVTPDVRRVAIASNKGLAVFDGESGRELWSRRFGGAPITFVAAGGRLLVGATLHDLDTGKQLCQSPLSLRAAGAGTRTPLVTALLADPPRLRSFTLDDACTFEGADHPLPEHALTGARDTSREAPAPLAISPDEKRVAFGHLVVDRASGAVIAEVPVKRSPGAAPRWITFSADGAHVLAIDYGSAHTLTVDAGTGALVSQNLPLGDMLAPAGAGEVIVARSGGVEIVSADGTRGLTQVTNRLTGRTRAALSAAYSADSATFAVAFGGVAAIDTQVTRGQDAVGRKDAAATAPLVHVFDRGTGQLQRTIEGIAAHALAFSPDGRWLALAAATETFLVDRKSDDPPRKLPGLPWTDDFKPRPITFSRDGARLYEGFGDRIAVTRVKDAVQEATLTAAPGPWHTIAAGPGARELFVGGSALERFDLARGTKPISTQPIPSPQVAVSRDGKLLATGEGRVFKIGKKLEAGPPIGPHARAFAVDGGGWLVVEGERRTKLAGRGESAPWQPALTDLYTPFPVGRPDGAEWLLLDRGAIHLVDRESNAERASLVAVGGSAYLWQTPDGYYSGTPGAAREVSIVSGFRVASVEDFDLRYNRPDKVLVALGSQRADLIDLYARAYAHRTRGRELSAEDPFAGAPEVEIVRPVPLDVKGETLEIAVQAKGAVALDVWLNDVPLFGRAGKPVSGARTTLTIPILKGETEIRVAGRDQAGVRSPSDAVSVRRTMPSFGPPRRVFVAALGVSRYKDSRYDLRYAAKDAADVTARFSVTSKPEVLLLQDAEVVREALPKVQAFFAQADPRDLAVLFVAGHGMLDDDLDYWFMTHDASFDAPKERALGHADLEQALAGTPALRKLLILDTCHSGAVDKSDTVLVAAAADRKAGTRGVKTKGAPVSIGTLGEITQALFSDLRRGSGVYVLASAGGTQLAAEGVAGIENGVFTHALLTVMQSRQTYEARTLSAMQRKVTEIVATLTSGEQRPSVRDNSATWDFAF